MCMCENGRSLHVLSENGSSLSVLKENGSSLCVPVRMGVVCVF